MIQLQFKKQRDKMFFPCIPGLAAYHGYKNLDVEDPKQLTSHDMEADSELRRQK